MASWVYFLLTFALTVHGAPEKLLQPIAESDQLEKVEQEDLKPASTSYSYQYSDWRGRYPGGYELSVTGNGIVDQQAGANYGDISGYNNVGYGGSPAYNSGYGGYKGYDGIGQSGFDGGVGGYGLIGGYGRSGGFPGSNGYAGSTGFGANSGYDGNVGYSGNAGYGGNFGNTGNVGYKGNGGYGGYGGNGGLSSYYGYNNPSYQGNNHLGYGYYNKRPGYGNIYNNGITPSLVTGYRGYSR